MMATNLSPDAKPWAPGSTPHPHHHQQPHHSTSQHMGNNYTSANNNMMHHHHHQQQQQYTGMGGSIHNNGAGANSMHNNMGNNNNNNLNHTDGHHQQQQQPQLSPTAAKLFVGQLPFECTEDRLRNLFTAYGTVEHIHILRDNSSRSRGAAFVTYSTVTEADTAIFTLHNRYRMLTNRAIQVSYAKNSPNISTFGTHSAYEVHESYPTNPVPDVAAVRNFPANYDSWE